MRQAAWQSCGVKRRSGGDTKPAERRSETALKPPARRAGVIEALLGHFQCDINRKQNARVAPPSSSTTSTSHKHGRTTHNNFGIAASQIPKKNRPVLNKKKPLLFWRKQHQLCRDSGVLYFKGINWGRLELGWQRGVRGTTWFMFASHKIHRFRC